MCQNKCSIQLALQNKSAALKKVLQQIDYEATNTDLIIRRSKLSAEQVSSALIELELEGLIISGQGGYALRPA